MSRVFVEEKGTFEITIAGQPYTFVERDASEGRPWVETIKDQITQHRRVGSVFGVPLEELLEREGRGSGIPLVVETLVEWLKANGATLLTRFDGDDGQDLMHIR